jgi:hypothetical protein
MSKTSPFSMRLPSDLKAELQKRADADRRSLTNFIEVILHDYVRQHPPRRHLEGEVSR